MEKYRTTLPAGYREVDVIDIKNDKRVRVWGDILSVLLMAATAGVGCFAVPLAELIHFDYTDMAALLSVLLRLIAAGLGGTAVIVLTCLLAAAAMRWCGAEKTNFGITKGLVCTVGCDGYFSRGAYARYTLTVPAILFAVILLAALVLPRSWFWVACSHFASEALFVKMLRDAARDAGVQLRQIEARQQCADHPILWGVEETNYLKFFIFQVV